MMQLSTAQAEAVCRMPSREIDRRKDKNLLPYSAPRRTRYSKQFYTPAQCLFLVLQDELRSKWDLTVGESAWAVRQVNAQVSEQWDLICRDGWLVRRAHPEGGVFNYWLSDRKGVLEFLAEPKGEDFQWSAEALAAEAEMRARNVPDAEIQKLLMAIEGERLLKFYKKKPRTVWVIHLTGILTVMEESARDLGFELPPREDRAAWFGVSAGK